MTRVAGVRLHHVVEGTGPPLLLLHGLTGSAEDWRHVFEREELARRYMVIVPDLLGHGRSPAPEGALTQHDCAVAVGELLDHLGVERVRAIGLSFGGNTLLHLATAQPARVEAMVLVSATPYFPEQARAIMRTQDSAHARAMAEDRDDLAFTPPRLAAITARTLVVNGDRDPLYPIELSLELFRAIPGAALWLIPDEGHSPVFGVWKETFGRVALRFLE